MRLRESHGLDRRKPRPAGFVGIAETPAPSAFEAAVNLPEAWQNIGQR